RGVGRALPVDVVERQGRGRQAGAGRRRRARRDCPAAGGPQGQEPTPCRMGLPARPVARRCVVGGAGGGPVEAVWPAPAGACWRACCWCWRGGDGGEDMIIAVDFDGTIVEHKYPRIGRAVPGALAWL